METSGKLFADIFQNLHLYLYLFSLFVVSGIIFFHAARNKVPLGPLSILLFATMFCSILGGKLFSFSFIEWQNILNTQNIPDTQNKTILGYIVFGIAGFYLFRYILKFKYPMGYAFAISWPIGLILTRFGCLIGGCCYGNPCQSFLGMSFGSESLAFKSQLSSGLISEFATHSLAVHPIPIYEIFFSLALIGVIYLIRKKQIIKGDSALFFISILSYSVFRFFEEFFRPGQEGIWALQKAQLIALVLTIILSIVVIFIEFSHNKPLKPEQEKNTGLNRMLLSMGLLLVLLIAISNWLTPTELFFLRVLSFISISAVTVYLFKKYSIKKIMALPVSIIITGFMLMSQTSTNPMDTSFLKKSYFTFSTAADFGKEEEICGGYNDYTSFAVNLEKSIEYKEKQTFSFGSQAYLINYDNITYPGITPYLRLDTKYAGFRLGLDYTTMQGAFRESNLLPSLALRIGRSDGFFVDGHFADHFPGSIPLFQVGIGISSKRFTGNHVRLGLSEAGFYLNPKINLDDQWSLDPFFAYGSTNNFQLALRLHYTFSEK